MVHNEPGNSGMISIKKNTIKQNSLKKMVRSNPPNTPEDEHDVTPEDEHAYIRWHISEY